MDVEQIKEQPIDVTIDQYRVQGTLQARNSNLSENDLHGLSEYTAEVVKAWLLLYVEMKKASAKSIMRATPVKTAASEALAGKGADEPLLMNKQARTTIVNAFAEANRASIEPLIQAMRTLTIAEMPSVMNAISEAHKASLEPLMQTLAALDAPSGKLAGEGLGEPLSETEAEKALMRITKPVPVENWAGEVLSAKEAGARLGVAPATINNWRQKAKVLSWPVPSKGHQYPAEQFENGGVLPGIAEVVAIQPDGCDAWQWLRTPHVDFSGSPLDALRHGEVTAVKRAALWSLG